MLEREISRDMEKRKPWPEQWEKIKGSRMHAVWAASQEANALFRSQPSNGQTGLAENEGSSSRSSDNDSGGRSIYKII